MIGSSNAVIEPGVGTIKITENGTYNVTKYRDAEVDVPMATSETFNTVVDLKAAGVNSADSWYKAAFVNWDVLPMMTFQIADSVTRLDFFFSASNVAKVKLTGGKNVTLMSQFANDVESLQEVDLSEFDATNLTNLWLAFSGCTSLRKVHVSDWKTPSLTDASYLFQYCHNLESADFSGWKAENLTDCEALFYLAQLNHIDIDMSGWRTTKVTNMSSAFRTHEGEGARYINISGWTTESLINNSRIFQAPGIEAIVIDSPSVFRLTSNDAFQYNRHPSVYVPDSLVDEYKAATNWVLVADQIKPLSELPQEIKDVFHM